MARLAPGLSFAAAQERLREDAVQRKMVSGDGTLCVARMGIDPSRTLTRV